MTDTSLTVADGLRDLVHLLTYEEFDGDVAREARLLLALAMQVDHGRLTLMARDPLDRATLHAAQRYCYRRCNGEPMSHIRGWRDFYGRRFAVDHRVLDPRPETETLVALALEHPFETVLDLGTGSGALIGTLLAERPEAVGMATDLSPEALEVAARNTETLGVLSRLALVECSWLDCVGGRFDLIVSNPPYIAADEMPSLAPELAHEPRMALTDEGDGLGAYRVIARDAPQHLAPGGRLMVEIGPTQGPAVSALFARAGLANIRVHPDLDGRDRVVSARKP